MSSLGNKKVELYDTGGDGEPTAEDNVQMASSNCFLKLLNSCLLMYGKIKSRNYSLKKQSSIWQCFKLLI